MKEIPATKFKATCLAVMDQVQKTRKPVRVTRYGKPVAEIVPVRPEVPAKKRELGFLRGSVEILGDIVGPVHDLSEFDAFKD